MRWDVLGLGCVAVDEVLWLEQFPIPDGQTRVLRRQASCGGMTANALVAASRLGARVAYAGVLGQDADSRLVRETFTREEIDLSAHQQRADVRPIHCTILVDATTHSRTVLYDLTDAQGAPEDVPAEVIRSSRVLLVDHFGVEGMTRATRIAREAGLAVVADFAHHGWPGFDQLQAQVDHLILSYPFAQQIVGSGSPEEVIDRLWNAERSLVALTDGAQGCWYRSAELSSKIQQIAGYQVKVVDTTGCGDTFHGVYAATLAWGWSVRERLRFASAAAALTATQIGGQAGCPTKEQVSQLLAAQPRVS